MACQGPMFVEPNTGIGMKDLVKFVKSLKNTNLKKSKNPLGRLLVSKWRYPVGKWQPALVLHMVPYVNDIERKVFIPGEIALASFTIQFGLGDSNFWTLIDPADKLRGHGIEAQYNAESYGLPQANYCERYQDYIGIVDAIEMLVMEAGMYKPISRLARSRTFNSGYIIFCMKDNVQDYTQGLQWLYEQAGQTFRHRLLPLESLMVILSMAGLDSISTRSNQKLSRVFETLHMGTTAIKGTQTCSFYTLDEAQRQLKHAVRHFGNAQKISIDTFTKIGSSQRIAGRQPEKYPFAMLGAFVFDEQATRYLNHMDFLSMSSLACDFHQDKVTYPPELVQWMEQRSAETEKAAAKRPSYHLTKCALMNVRKQIFLALDVLMVNYGIQVQEGKHYPKPEPRPSRPKQAKQQRQ